MKMNIGAALSCLTALFQVLIIVRGEIVSDLVADHIEGCSDTIVRSKDIAENPSAYAKRTYRDFNDFKDFPDKSKGPQRNNYTWSEMAELDGEDDRHLCLALDRKVYDFTDFADQHPPGPEVLKKYVGRDAKLAFKTCGIPPKLADPVLHLFLVGQLADSENGAYENADQDDDC